MSRVILGLLLMAVASCGGDARGEEETGPAAAAADQSAQPDEVRKELLTGQVKFLGPALRDRGVKAFEEMDKQVVLITDAGELVPLVADWRGRAFYQDERLRDRKVQLAVRRHAGSPYAQVLIVYTFDEKGERKYTDYWCDICSFPMYEIKDCDCCQGPVHLRFIDRPLPAYLQKEVARDAEQGPEPQPDDVEDDEK